MSAGYHIKRLRQERCDYFPHEKRVKRHFALTSGPIGDYFETDQTPTKFRMGEKGFLMHAYCAMANICTACNACVPLRVNLDKFFITPTQHKRMDRLGYDGVFYETPDLPEDELFLLFQKYTYARHPKSSMRSMDRDEFRLLISRMPLCMVLARKPADGSSAPLQAYALMDIFETSMSFDYAVYDPLHAKDSLGKILWLTAMQSLKEKGMDYVYVGSWAQGSPKLDYKKNHAGLEAFVDGAWIDFNPDLHTQGPDYRAMLRRDGFNI